MKQPACFSSQFKRYLSVLLLILFCLLLSYPSVGHSQTSPISMDLRPLYQVNEESQVTIHSDVSSSDGKITYLRWRQLSGPPVSIKQVYSTPTLRFSSPSLSSAESKITLKFELLAKDEKSNEHRAFTEVQIQHVSQGPEVKLLLNGEYQSSTHIKKLNYLDEMTLNCELRTEETDEKISVKWQQIAGIKIALASPDLCMQTFSLPATPSQYQFRLTATNEAGQSSTESLSFQAFSPLYSTEDHTLQTIFPPAYHNILRYQDDLVVAAVGNSIKVYQFVAQTYFKLVSQYDYSKEHRIIHFEIFQDKLFATIRNGGIYIFDIEDPQNISLIRQLPSFSKSWQDTIPHAYTDKWVATSYQGFFKLWKFVQGKWLVIDATEAEHDGFTTTNLAVAGSDNDPIFIREKSRSAYGSQPKILELYKIKDNKLTLDHTIENYPAGYRSKVFVNNNQISLFYGNKLQVVNASDYSSREYTLPLPNGHILDRSYMLTKGSYLYYVYNTEYNQRPESGLSIYQLSPSLELNLLRDISLHYPQVSP